MAVLITLTNADIVARLSVLSDFYGRATSGSTTEVTKIIPDAEDDDYNNYYMCFINGANKGEDRIVTDFVATTGVFTLDVALGTAVSNTSEFALLETGYLAKMEEAFSVIEERIKNIGAKIELFLTTSQLKELQLYKTLDLICTDLYRDATDEDMYWSNHRLYSDRFEDTFNSLRADYDSNEDGIIQEDEELQGGSHGFLTR